MSTEPSQNISFGVVQYRSNAAAAPPAASNAPGSGARQQDPSRPQANEGISTRVTFQVAKNVMYEPLEEGKFEFGLFDERCQLLGTARNDGNGLVTFENIEFWEGINSCFVKEIFDPDDPDASNWDMDAKRYPVNITVMPDENNDPMVSLSYPEGMPSFKNTHQASACGMIEFPELSFTEPGDYEYFLREETPSGNGWVADSKRFPVIIHVTEDGYGNLVATAEYPEGYPEFVDVYAGQAARITLSACKLAIGSAVEDGQFTFGLYDANCGETALHTATNKAALETVVADNAQLISSARTYLRQLETPGNKTGMPRCGGACRAAQRRLEELKRLNRWG